MTKGITNRSPTDWLKSKKVIGVLITNIYLQSEGKYYKKVVRPVRLYLSEGWALNRE